MLQKGNRRILLLLLPRIAALIFHHYIFNAMKVLLIILALLASSALFWFCKHTKYAPGSFPDHQIRWGSGGGFVGKETTYTLLDNGQIFVRKLGGDLTSAGATKTRVAKSIYKTVENLGLANLNFQHPGNTYSFMEVLSGDSVQRVSWGDPAHPVDADVKALFDQLNGLLDKK